MDKALTADDILPLIAALTREERVRLVRLISSPEGRDNSIYASMPPRSYEFVSDDELLAWEADGWENVG